MSPSGVAEGELEKLRPRDVARYLSGRGWSPAGRVRYSQRWTLAANGREHRVLLPLEQDLADYPDRMADLLEVLSALEGRPALSVHQDLLLGDLDVQYIRTTPPSPSGTIPVSDGVLAVTSARDLLLAAACEEVQGERRAVQPRRKPQRAKDFMDTARFGPSQAGSYIITVQVPLPSTSAGSLFEEDPDQDITPAPFERQVSRRLYEAVTSARLTAAEASEADDFQPFEDAVSDGVSADLCEALVGLAGERRRPFDISYAWSPRWALPYRTSRTEFPAHLVSVLKEGAQDLRRHAPQQGVTLVGRTKTLKRVGDIGPGEITMEARQVTDTGDLSGQLRQVHLRLDEFDYDRATTAHRDRVDLKITGDLARKGNYFTLANISSFDVLPDWT
ncbi:hypothetical protein [Streptomyces sp. NPDC051561]|uniref:hypothetical protein n=1 Tax=Streptomyces sp. NPDC051561 TaxID=3365658 RepID=UPI00379C6C47